jgi:hypothetical protein
MCAMISRLHYRVRDLLMLTLWLALAFTAVRLLYFPESRQWIHGGVMMLLVLSFFVAPFAAVGAMWDRFWMGLLCGIGVVLVMAVMLYISNS